VTIVHNDQMTTEARLERLASYKLADWAADADQLDGDILVRSKRALADDIDDPDAAIAAGGIVSFLQGMSRKNKDDVLNSFMFARLAASYQYDSKAEGDQWYKLFIQVMSDFGWVGFKDRYTRYTASERRFTMDQVGLKILATAIAAASLPGPAAAALLTVAEGAVAALQQNTEALRLFERQSRKHRDADFAIASGMQLQDGDLLMAMGSVHITATTEVTNVLFTEWQSSSVSIVRAEDVVVLNRSAFTDEVSRELVVLLGDHTKTSLKKYKI